MIAAAPLAAVGEIVRQGVGLIKGGDKVLNTFDEAKNVLNKDILPRTMAGQGRSLTQKLRQSFITSRVFIDGSLYNDEIVTDIIKVTEIIYIGLLTNAVEMDQLVDGVHTVSSHLSSIQTHQFEALDTPFNGFSDSVTALEELDDSLVAALSKITEVSVESKQDRKNAFDDEEDYEKKREKAYKEDTHYTRAFPTVDANGKPVPEKRSRYLNELKRETEFNRAEKEYRDSLPISKETNGKLTDLKRESRATVDAVDQTVKSGALPATGRFVKLKLRDPKNGMSVDLPIIVRMYPFVINPITMGHILSGYGVSADKGHRWLQFRAGEVTFWKDLVFQQDRMRKMAKDLRNDRTGQLSEYLRGVSRKDRFRFLENLARLGHGSKYRPSSNLLNSVIIASEESVIRAKADGAGDFDNYHSRQKFFDSSYAMMMFVVDPNHEQVKFYINGLEPVAHYKFRDLKEKKGDDNKELLKIVASMAAGRAAQF